MQITPKILKGFRDFLPDGEIRRKQLVHILEDQFRLFGFVPIDTPVLEYAEVLLGKGGGETDKQVYRFEDHGNRDVAMRFDLTVPFARYMAMHRNELYLPFKRFHVNKVFRGENTQRGRYREFMQCDFDIVGTETLSSDLDIILMIVSAFSALGVPGVSVHISHRGVFNQFLQVHGAAHQSEEILRVVDKLRKVGEEQTLQTLTELTDRDTAKKTLAFINADGTYQEILDTIEELSGGPGPESTRLREIGEALPELVPDNTVVLDPSITRGLDYYTGVVFETFLTGAESIGSVCSGGRYDDLVSLYSRESMPGVGASIGLDRLLAALDELEVATGDTSAAEVLITMQDPDLTAHYHRIATVFRAAGVRAEVYPDPQKLGKQFAFAERKGIPLAAICGPEERRKGTVNLRVLATRENKEGLDLDHAIEAVRNLA